MTYCDASINVDFVSSLDIQRVFESFRICDSSNLDETNVKYGQQATTGIYFHSYNEQFI